MRNLKDIILERLVLAKNKNPEYTLFPTTKDELKKMIKLEIMYNGNKCSLNHIDVSKITDMSYLFFESEFNGDISKWDVSNVTNMCGMFWSAKFDGDISNWNVSNVTDMSSMFQRSRFTGKNGDISKWDVSSVTKMTKMITDCSLQNNPPKWYR